MLNLAQQGSRVTACQVQQLRAGRSTGSYPTAGVGSRMGLLPEAPALSMDARMRFPEERPRELLSLVASLLGAPARAPSSSTQAPYSSSRSSKSGPASVLQGCGRKMTVIIMRHRMGVQLQGSSVRKFRCPAPPPSPPLLLLPQNCLRDCRKQEKEGSPWGEVHTRARCSERRCL